MKKSLLLCLCVLFFNSCATLLNPRTTKVNVYTEKPTTVTTEDGTFATKKNKVTVRLKRARKPADINIGGEEVKLKSKPSTAFFGNFFWGPYGLGGAGLDLITNKWTTYQRMIYWSNADSIPRLLKYRPQNRVGEVNLHISLPFHFLHSFHFHPSNEASPSRSFGFWDTRLGLDYYHAPKQYLQLSIATATNRPYIPFAIVDIRGKYEVMESTRIALTNHHKIKRLTLGYGVHFAHNFWSVRYVDAQPPVGFVPRKANTDNLGMTFSAYYQTGSYFYIGFIYQPNFLRLNGGGNAYGHILGVDFAWKIE